MIPLYQKTSKLTVGDIDIDCRLMCDDSVHAAAIAVLIALLDVSATYLDLLLNIIRLLIVKSSSLSQIYEASEADMMSSASVANQGSCYYAPLSKSLYCHMMSSLFPIPIRSERGKMQNAKCKRKSGFCLFLLCKTLTKTGT